MDRDRDIQRILIRRQRDLGSLDTLVSGISATQDDLLLSLAIVPITDLAPKLETLINHARRNLGSRHRIGLFTIQRRCGQVLDHRSRNVLGGTTRGHQLDDKPQQYEHQDVQEIGSPRTSWGWGRCQKSRKRLHLYDRGKNEPTHVRRERVDVLQ